MALNKSTLSEQIYQILRSDILHQRIPLGEKLTLKNLQAQFEVSSTPIREALTRLTEDGLVRYYSNIIEAGSDRALSVHGRSGPACDSLQWKFS